MNKKELMSVIEVGLVVNPSPIYEQEGFSVETFGSLRKALTALNRRRPDVIACEFIYLPTYSMRISNIEPLLAAMELRCPEAGLLIYVEPEQQRQLQRLDLRGRRVAVVTVPASAAAIAEALRQLCP